MEEITAAYVRRLLPRRDPMGHKGTFGKVLCVCGSVGFSGAAVFAGRAAETDSNGNPYLKEHMVSRIACKVVDQMEIGSFLLFVGQATEAEV